MEPTLEEKLNELSENQKAIFASVERTRKYMLWSFITQIVMIVLPLLALMFAIPFALSSLSKLTEGVL